MTYWIYRAHIAIPASSIESAKDSWQVSWPGGEAERLTFSTPLSADGNDPFTHWASSTVMTEELKAAALDDLQSIPGSLHAVIEGDSVVETNVPGLSEASFEAFLQAAGLARLERPLPGEA